MGLSNRLLKLVGKVDEVLSSRWRGVVFVMKRELRKWARLGEVEFGSSRGSLHVEVVCVR